MTSSTTTRHWLETQIMSSVAVVTITTVCVVTNHFKRVAARHQILSPEPPSNPAVRGVYNRSHASEVDAAHIVGLEPITAVLAALLFKLPRWEDKVAALACAQLTESFGTAALSARSATSSFIADLLLA
eukprot:CAMPEP_0179436804 /NCGR_PEP_ID=MMETSP0799-20121207/20780_1 /TAXON_ID=46947 /ORGANISM="Geminigera cryophila, Strain CCMP2564" /LENGTH=128 /DNA_ID=CAMNT_0021217273 /DNA_START=739 /DNA_END=1122 /DNA_ORIENTATION=-